jgi:hypothetical protein
MLWRAKELIAFGLIDKLFYIVLVMLGLAAMVFVFRVVRSSAYYRGVLEKYTAADSAGRDYVGSQTGAGLSIRP